MTVHQRRSDTPAALLSGLSVAPDPSGLVRLLPWQLRPRVPASVETGVRDGQEVEIGPSVETSRPERLFVGELLLTPALARDAARLLVQMADALDPPPQAAEPAADGRDDVRTVITP